MTRVYSQKFTIVGEENSGRDLLFEKIAQHQGYTGKSYKDYLVIKDGNRSIELINITNDHLTRFGLLLPNFITHTSAIIFCIDMASDTIGNASKSATLRRKANLFPSLQQVLFLLPDTIPIYIISKQNLEFPDEGCIRMQIDALSSHLSRCYPERTVVQFFQDNHTKNDPHHTKLLTILNTISLQIIKRSVLSDRKKKEPHKKLYEINTAKAFIKTFNEEFKTDKFEIKPQDRKKSIEWMKFIIEKRFVNTGHVCELIKLYESIIKHKKFFLYQTILDMIAIKIMQIKFLYLKLLLQHFKSLPHCGEKFYQELLKKHHNKSGIASTRKTAAKKEVEQLLKKEPIEEKRAQIKSYFNL